MYSSFLRKENTLALGIIIVSLCAGAYFIAHGQTAPSPAGSASGICYIRNAYTNAPGLSSPDVGNGYAKVVKPGITSLEGLRAACTKADYDALIDKICAQNPYDKDAYGAGEVSDGVSFTAGCTAPGCGETRRCPVPPPQPPPPPSPTPPAPPAEGKTFTYPIPELEGCRNESECRAFCDNPENRIGVCWEFAKKHNLVTKEEVARAEKFTKAAISGGPGSCKNDGECFKYCDAPEHLDECIDFAEKNGFATKNELVEARKFSAHLKRGGKTPGDCRGKESCLAYCAAPERAEECFNFAKEAGFLDKETEAQAGKFIGYMQRGETPGRCTSKDSCEAYCSEEGHFDECISFAEKAGLLRKEELEIAKKVGGRGPGGCTSRESCEAFCNEGTNQDICIKFAEDHGLLSAEELGQIKKFGSLREALGQAPPEVLNCLGEQVGTDIVQKLLNGVLVPNPDVIKGVRACFESGKGAIEKQLASCVSLSCGEAVICLEKLRGAETKDFKFDIPPDIREKVTGCKQEEFDQRARSCIAMSCSEAISCIQNLGEGDQKGEGEPIPGLEEKISDCYRQMQGGDGREGGAPPMPQSFDIPKGISPEEIKKQIEEQYRTQYGEQKPPEQQFTEQSQPQQIPQEYCANFAQVPSCSYVGEPGSQNYNYCKQCYPDR